MVNVGKARGGGRLKNGTGLLEAKPTGEVKVSQRWITSGGGGGPTQNARGKGVKGRQTTLPAGAPLVGRPPRQGKARPVMGNAGLERFRLDAENERNTRG